MAQHLVLAGAGHAHMAVLADLGAFVGKGYRVTVVGPTPHHYYSGMGPGMLGGAYRPEEVRFAVRAMAERRGATYLEDRVVRIDAPARRMHLASGAVLDYDVASCNVGSGVTLRPSPPGNAIFPVKPIEGLLAAGERLGALVAREAGAEASSEAAHVVVVGGGPASVELAGNVWRLATRVCRAIPTAVMPRITVLAGRRFLPRAPEGVRRHCLRSLTRRGVSVREAGYVADVAAAGQGARLTLATGEVVDADMALLATGIRPASLFADSGLSVGPDGGMAVNRFLQSLDDPALFGGGDCIHFADRPLDKVGVYAVRQNPILRHNLMAVLDAGDPARAVLRPFAPQRRYLLLYNLGDGTAVGWNGWFTFSGWWAFRLKDFLDRRFMRAFQA
ncbi:MAG: NAD(P)/FAD-dependent oxidoreductase [Desulfovibrionaceae bacterium]